METAVSAWAQRDKEQPIVLGAVLLLPCWTPLGVTWNLPDPFALAAAEATDENADDEDASQHRHGDDQDLEVDCELRGTVKLAEPIAISRFFFTPKMTKFHK